MNFSSQNQENNGCVKLFFRTRLRSKSSVVLSSLWTFTETLRVIWKLLSTESEAHLICQTQNGSPKVLGELIPKEDKGERGRIKQREPFLLCCIGFNISKMGRIE